MARYSVNHLVRRSATFYFRRAIPISLRGRFARDEINVSLRTSDPVTAKRLCRRLSSFLEAFFAWVEQMEGPSPEEINTALRSYFAQLLTTTEEVISFAALDPKFDRELEIEQSHKEIQELRRRMTTYDFDLATTNQTRQLASAFPGQSTPIGIDLRNTLSVGVLRARIAQTTLYLQRLQGIYADAQDPLFKGIEQQEAVAALRLTDTPLHGPSIRDVVNKYVIFKRATHQWVPKTEAENSRLLNWFIEIVGDEFQAAKLAVDHCRDFRDRLLVLPANFTKGAGNAAKTFKAATEQAIAGKVTHPPRLAPKTARKYFDNFKGFLNWAENEGHIPKNPARKLVIYKKDEGKGRQPFSTDQLIQFFTSPIYRGYLSFARRSKPGTIVTRDGKFWIPLIGLFTGLRLGEIVQLLVSDIKTENGIDYFDINKGEPAHGKTLKTAQSARRVPIHGELKKIGFLAYVLERRAKDSSGRLFPEIAFGQDGYASHNFSKFFGRYTVAIGVKQSVTTFHSLRHNFVDALRNAGVDDARYKALIGHKDTSVTAGYGEGFNLHVLKADVDKVAYPVDFSGIYLGS